MARKSKYTPDQRAALRKARQKKQEKYWEDRAQTRVLATDRQVDDIRKDSDRAYRDARDAVRREIDKFYRDFATAAGISEDEARRKLSRGELQDFKRELERKRRIIREMIQKDPDNDKLRAYDTEFEKLSKVRELTRKEALESNIKAEIVKLGGTQEQQMNARSDNVVNTALWMNSADLAMLGDVKENLGVGHPKQVERAARENWQYGDFSDRIWDDKEKLIREAREVIENGFAHNKGAYDMAGDLMTCMNVSHSNALRLVRTEFNHLSNQAALAEYQAKGIRKYKFVSAIDSRTCDVCAELNGQVFNVADAKTGKNFPPMHPNCRSVTVPVIDWDDEDAWDYSDIELDDDELKKLGLTDDDVAEIDAETPRDEDAPAPSLSVQQANQATEDTQSVQRRAELAEAVKQQGEAIEIKARHINDDVDNILDEIGSQEKLNAKLYADAPITLPQAAIEAEHLDNVRTKILKAELDAEKLQLRAAKLDESVPKPDPKRATALEDEIEQRKEAHKRRQDADLPNDEVVKQATPKPFEITEPDATDAIEPRTAFGKWWQKVRDAVERAKERFNAWVSGFTVRKRSFNSARALSNSMKSITDDQLVYPRIENWDDEKTIIKWQLEETRSKYGKDDTRTQMLQKILDGKCGALPNHALAVEVSELQSQFERLTGKQILIEFIEDNELPGLFEFGENGRSFKITLSREAKPSVIHHEMTHALQYNRDNRIQGDAPGVEYKTTWFDYVKNHPNRQAGIRVWKDLTANYSVDAYRPGGKADKALMHELFDKTWSELNTDERSIMHAFREIHASLSGENGFKYGHEKEEYGKLNIEAVASIKEILSFNNENAKRILAERYKPLLNIVVREWSR